MKRGIYVFPGVYALDRETGEPTPYLMIFGYTDKSGLIPEPIVGVNVSKMPEGEGVPYEYRKKKFRQSREN